MLSTFLSQLQTYFSKYFVIGSFFPMLAFAFVNGMTAYLIFAAWQGWVDSNIFSSSAGRGAFLTTSMVVAIILAGYVLNSLSTFLSRVLEGHWWAPLTKLFIPAQNRRREKLINGLDSARIDLVDLADVPQWEQQMRDAREKGLTKQPGKKLVRDNNVNELEILLKHLESLRSKNETLRSAELESCVNKLKPLLSENDADAELELGKLHTRLGALFDYAKERARAHLAHMQNEVNSNFGAQEVAATKMGNVANTIQSYALRRYKCNLEVVWSNLQRVVQKDEKAQAALQEAKTQLDFLVACCWLTLLWALIWSIVLGWVEPSRKGFLLVALGGPALSYLWYRAAAEQYRSFADVAMTTLDAFRFDLLHDLRLGAPADVEDERSVWEGLDQLSTYGEIQNFRYEPAKRKETNS
jgi:hypothetical protein